MASVAFAFGSFGDIIAAITLICELTKALREGHISGNAEYDELMLELAALEGVLIEMKQLVVTQGSPLLNSQASLNALWVAVKKCSTAIKEFKDNTQGHASGDSSSNLWNFWRRTSWAMSKRQAAVILRAELMRQQVAMTVILSMATCVRKAQFKSKGSVDRSDGGTTDVSSASVPTKGVPEGTPQPSATEWWSPTSDEGKLPPWLQYHPPPGPPPQLARTGYNYGPPQTPNVDYWNGSKFWPQPLPFQQSQSWPVSPVPPLSPINGIFNNPYSFPPNLVGQEAGMNYSHYLPAPSPPKLVDGHGVDKSIPHIIILDDEDSDSSSDTGTVNSHTIHSPVPTPLLGSASWAERTNPATTKESTQTTHE